MNEKAWPLGGAVSFEELERQAGEGGVEALRQARLDDQFLLILNNIAYSPDLRSTEKRGLLHQLVSTYDTRSGQVADAPPPETTDDAKLLLPDASKQKGAHTKKFRDLDFLGGCDCCGYGDAKLKTKAAQCPFCENRL